MALLTLFEVSTFDNWSNILQVAIDSHLEEYVNHTFFSNINKNIGSSS